METKRINLSAKLTPVILREAEANIAVPAGEHHYHLERTEGAGAYTFTLSHPESILFLTGKIITNETSELTTTVIHSAPFTRAETLIRTLGRDKSKSSFKGMIKIAPGAHDCESYLNHHSLLFDEARSYTWPALEIGNNAVKCSHAATVRTITDLDLFYARSRGIPEEAAQKLMIEAFFSDVAY